MSCYYPMLAVRSGTNPSGKPKYTIASRFEGVKLHLDDQVVPCGQCIGCRLDYSRQWANRMMCEIPYHTSAYFLTLTYNDGHIPISYYPDPDTGEAFESLSLLPDDLKDFMKRLRRQQEYHGNDKHIAFFACGEYGEHNKRPHYHLIVYDVDFPDLEPCGRSQSGDFQYYKSDTLDKLWSAPALRSYTQVDRGKYVRFVEQGEKSPIGNTQICNVSWETCAYVARYIVKKQKGNTACYYDTFNLVPEFTRMSLKPAIGKQYYDDHHGQIYEYDKLYLKTKSRGIVANPPAYFDRLFDIEYPDEMDRIKAARKRVADKALAAKLQRYSGNYFDLLSAEEQARLQKLKKKVRCIE